MTERIVACHEGCKRQVLFTCVMSQFLLTRVMPYYVYSPFCVLQLPASASSFSLQANLESYWTS